MDGKEKKHRIRQKRYKNSNLRSGNREGERKVHEWEIKVQERGKESTAEGKRKGKRQEMKVQDIGKESSEERKGKYRRGKGKVQEK